MPDPIEEYSRVATYLRARFRALEGPDDPAHAPQVAVYSAPSALRENFSAQSHLPEAVTKFLCQLDCKMDLLLANRLSGGIEQEFPHHLEISAISATELLFTTSIPLAPGDWIEVVINLGQQGLYSASGIGYVDKRRVPTEDTSVFSFIFTRIAEEDREKIIQFVFSEQRKLLRETRLNIPLHAENVSPRSDAGMSPESSKG